MSAVLLGVGLGALVAAQPGPVSLLLVRTVARGRRAAGLAVGASAALVDALYAGLGVAGAAPLLQIDALRIALGLVGAAVLVLLGVRTLWSAWRVRAGLETEDELATPGRAFGTGFAATASNPLTIASWAAIFAAASVAGAASSTAGAVSLVAGITLGSLAWYAVLTALASRLARSLGDRWVTRVDMVCGVGLTGFGGLLAWRTTTS